jgi:hypothetical protein
MGPNLNWCPIFIPAKILTLHTSYTPSPLLNQGIRVEPKRTIRLRPLALYLASRLLRLNLPSILVPHPLFARFGNTYMHLLEPGILLVFQTRVQQQFRCVLHCGLFHHHKARNFIIEGSAVRICTMVHIDRSTHLRPMRLII